MNEFIPPNSIFREMPGLDNFPKDEIGREITMLVFDHPDQFGEINTDILTLEEKVKMLDAMKMTLGILPVVSSHLSYVGPID